MEAKELNKIVAGISIASLLACGALGAGCTHNDKPAGQTG